MKWEKAFWKQALILLSAAGLLAVTISLRHAHATPTTEPSLSGYTSHSERVTEYLFNGSEGKFVWV